MSRRSLLKRSKLFHSPCDDLESFVWVTLWTVIEKAEGTGKVFLGDDQRRIFCNLSSLAIQSVLVGKTIAHDACCIEEEEFPMKGMFEEWFMFLDENMRKRDIDWPSVYDGFFEIGFRHFNENKDSLWSSWAEVFRWIR